MSHQNENPDASPTPSPEQLTAWADGELSRCEAAAIEAWFADHPDALREAESLQQVTRLYRDHAPPLPCPARWQATLDAIEPRVRDKGNRKPHDPSWRLHLLLGLTMAAAAVFGAVVVARSLWFTTSGPEVGGLVVPLPDPELQDDAPFEVARGSEVNIIHMDADDADRIVTGQPLMGNMEFVSNTDNIDLVQVEPSQGEKHTVRLEQRWGMPMIVAALSDDDQP